LGRTGADKRKSEFKNVLYSRSESNSIHSKDGCGGIRTPGELSPTPVFKTGALNHSATHPEEIVIDLIEPVVGHPAHRVSPCANRVYQGRRITQRELVARRA